MDSNPVKEYMLNKGNIGEKFILYHSHLYHTFISITEKNYLLHIKRKWEADNTQKYLQINGKTFNVLNVSQSNG